MNISKRKTICQRLYWDPWVFMVRMPDGYRLRLGALVGIPRMVTD